MNNKTGRPQRTIFISSQTRLLIGFTLLFTAVFAGAYYWFYTYSTNAATKRIEQDVLDTLNGAREGINVEEFVGLAKDGVARADGYTDDPRYWDHVSWLVKVTKVEPRAQVYTYVAGKEKGEVIFIGSIGALANPPWGAKFKETYTSSGSGTANLLTGLDHDGADLGIYTDKFGSWVSGYGPIKDAQGNIVGAVGVDFRADYVTEVQQGILNSMILAFAVTYIILFTLVYVISLFFTRPIVTITRMAERVGEGNYEQDFSSLKKGRLRNEFSTLADVFEIMVQKVRQREQTLIQTVEKLKIEIDEKKRKAQVNEIADTEFFRDLQKKAREMRNRSADEDPNT